MNISLNPAAHAVRLLFADNSFEFNPNEPTWMFGPIMIVQLVFLLWFVITWFPQASIAIRKAK